MNVRQMLWLALCLLGVALLTIFLWWSGAGATQQHQLRLVTGPENGSFLSLGQGIAEIVTDPSITINAVSSDGSTQNMAMLEASEADLAIVHNDTEPLGDVCTLIPLHRGVCHFLVPASSQITDIHDLRMQGSTKRRVAVGSKQSGNWHVVHQLLFRNQ